MKSVKSGLPRDVIEKPVGEEGKPHADRIVECFVGGNLVGRRIYNYAGILIMETPMKAGLKQGREITWRDDGSLLLIEPYVKGKVHGTARQYGHDGKVIGTYTMIHGTGFDIWRQENEDDTVFVSEIHRIRDGVPHGYEWGFASSRMDIWYERHWNMGKLHGIERLWNSKGRLRPGYPKFYAADEPVTRQKYIKLTLTDTTLPVFRESDNLPHREMPAEVEALLGV